ncbi:MAG: GldG family protein [Patescibacteria group bacterium]|nr:GldG family protein [Patescibacteria group bacterium]
MNLNRKIKNQANLITTTLIIVGILAVVNFLSYQIFYRFDLTEGKDYSISSTTKNSLKSLDDVVSIKLYFSKELPSEYMNLKQDIKDILDEYKSYSGGKIKIEEINPGDSEEEQQKIQMLGIPKLRFNVVENDKYQTLGGYLGMVIYFEDKKEVIPVVSSSKNLEYEITMAIKKLTLDKIPVIGFTVGNGEVSLNDELTIIGKELKKQYGITAVDLSDGNLISDNIDTLIILGPTAEINERSKYVIDQFLMRSGSLLIAQDSVVVDQQMAVSQNRTGLNDILNFYGLKINDNLILDGASNEIVSFSTGGFFPSLVNYPFWPKILKENFDKSNPATANLETAFFPWASSVDVLPEKIGDNKILELVKTTDESWAVSENINLDPFQKFAPQPMGQQTLATSIFGKFESFYKDKDIPKKENEESDSDGKEEFVSSVDSARITVIGDADFVKDNFLSRNMNNLIFFQNVIDSLTLDPDLINIRSKGVTSRPIEEVSEAKKMSIKYFNIFGVTVLVIVLGIIKYNLRKRRRFVEEDEE